MNDKYKKLIKHTRTWNNTPTVFQMETTECGAACLGMILGYYKCFVGLEELRDRCGVSRDGCSAESIIKASESYGLDAQAYAYSLEELLIYDKPCILHWNFNHFVVYEGIKNGKIYINDPSFGRVRISLEEMSNSFTGVVIELKPNDSFKIQSRPSSLISSFMSRCKSNHKDFIPIIIYGLVLIMPNILIANSTRVFVDHVFSSHDTQIFEMIFFVMCLSIFIQILLTVLKTVLTQKFRLKLSFVSGLKFLWKFLVLPISFFDQRFAGDLSQRININDEATSFFSGEFLTAIFDIVASIIFLGVMIVYNVYLSVISFVAVMIGILVVFRLFKLSNELAIKYSQDRSKLMGFLFHGTEIFPSIKASGCEKNFVSRLIGQYSIMGRNDRYIKKLSDLIVIFPDFIISIFNIVLLVCGSVFVIKSGMTIGTLSGFLIIFTSFCAPIKNIHLVFDKYQQLRSNFMRFSDIDNYKIDEWYKEDVSKGKFTYCKNIYGPLEIKNLTFGYNINEDPIIENFSFKVNPCETVAIVGPTGCCKSTVINLINSIYHPWSGEILINNKSLEEYTRENLIKSISTISQDIVLFNGTIRENLTIWNDSVYEKDIVEAAKDACIHDDITSMPGGYNYKLNYGGTNISCGQRQRIEIARSLISNPSILLIDEGTSSLDAITEKKILNNIKKRGCLCVIVAHRLSTIRDADRIICMDKGKIVEVGTHEQLLNNHGIYYKLVKNY